MMVPICRRDASLWRSLFRKVPLMSTGLAASVESDRHTTPVWESISQIVQQRGLQDGDQLPSIRELADMIRVKHSVIRDALLRAETTGLVTIRPRMGAFLRSPAPAHVPSTPPSPRDTLVGTLHQGEHNLFHLLDARRLIEIELVGRAAERRRLEDLLPVRKSLEGMLAWTPECDAAEYVQLDIHFHVEIAQLAGNTTLLTLQQSLMEVLRPHLNEVPRDAARQAVTDRSHRQIYAALAQGDAERARTAMRKHLSLAYDSLLQDLQEPPKGTRPRAAVARNTMTEKSRRGVAS